MEVKLIVVNGKQKGKEIPVAAPKFLIGRGEGCQLRPQNSLVSRKHCAILTEGNSAAVEDLGSTNGTFVNDERIHGRHELKDGDTIKVGVLDVEVNWSAPRRSQRRRRRKRAGSGQGRRLRRRGLRRRRRIDVSRWLGEDDVLKSNPPRKEPARTDDTMAGKSLVDTTTIPVPLGPHKERKETGVGEDRRQAAASAGETDDRQQRRSGRRRAAAFFPPEEALRFANRQP